MITDGIDAALIRFDRSERAADAEYDETADLMRPGEEFHPFAPKNFDEAMGSCDEATTIKVCACFQAENFAIAAEIIFDHCVDYWTERADAQVKKNEAKREEEWRAAA
jgi:hypothetical protein